jgi:hypothetical protein
VWATWFVEWAEAWVAGHAAEEEEVSVAFVTGAATPLVERLGGVGGGVGGDFGGEKVRQVGVWGLDGRERGGLRLLLLHVFCIAWLLSGLPGILRGGIGVTSVGFAAFLSRYGWVSQRFFCPLWHAALRLCSDREK